MNDIGRRDCFTGIFAEAGYAEVTKFHPLRARIVKDVFGLDVLVENFEPEEKIAQSDLHLPVDVGQLQDFDQPAPGKAKV